MKLKYEAMRWFQTTSVWERKCETPFGKFYLSKIDGETVRYFISYPWECRDHITCNIITASSFKEAQKLAEDEYEKILLKCLNEPCQWSVDNRREHIAIFKTPLSEVRFFQKTTPAGEVVYHTELKGEPEFKSLDYAKAFCLERFKRMVFDELELEVAQTVRLMFDGGRFKYSDIIKI